MASDVLSLIDNPRMLIAAIVPPFATLAVSLTDTPVRWPIAFVPAGLVVVMLVWKAVRQRALKNPAKVWRGFPRESFAFDVVAMIAATFGILYATRPWDEAFTVVAATAMGGGFALGASAFYVVAMPLWILLARRGEGPLKSAYRRRRPIETVGNALAVVLFAGPTVGYFGTLPITLLYIEEVASANPSFVSRELWLVVLTVIVVVPLSVLWAYLDLRKRRSKLERG